MLHTIFILNIYICPLFFTLYFFFQKVLQPMNECAIAGRMANCIDPDQTPRSAADCMRYGARQVQHNAQAFLSGYVEKVR